MTNPNFINQPVIDLTELQAIPGKIYRLSLALYNVQSDLDAAIQEKPGQSRSCLDRKAKDCLGRRAQIERLKQEYEFGMALLRLAPPAPPIGPNHEMKIDFASTACDEPNPLWEALRDRKFHWKRGPVTTELRDLSVAAGGSGDIGTLTIEPGPGKVPLQSIAEADLEWAEESAPPHSAGFVQGLGGAGGSGVDTPTIGRGGAGGVSLYSQLDGDFLAVRGQIPIGSRAEGPMDGPVLEKVEFIPRDFTADLPAEELGDDLLGLT